MDESGSNPNPEEDLPSASLFQSEEAATAIRQHILVVEDNQPDVFLIRQAIEMARLPFALHVVNDGEQAIRFFDDADSNPAAPCPALVLLDINLPRKHGGEVLDHLRKSRRCANALVLVVSTSQSARDREEMMRLGADGYFHKPSQFDEFMKLGEIIRTLLAARPHRASSG